MQKRTNNKTKECTQNEQRYEIVKVRVKKKKNRKRDAKSEERKKFVLNKQRITERKRKREISTFLTCRSLYLSVCLSVCSSVCLFVRLSVCLSVPCMFVPCVSVPCVSVSVVSQKRVPPAQRASIMFLLNLVAVARSISARAFPHPKDFRSLKTSAGEHLQLHRQIVINAHSFDDMWRALE